MRFMALFIAFDAMYFTFVGALKGAGDRRFIMWRIRLATLVVMVLPLTVIVVFMDEDLVAWGINLTMYVVTLFAVTLGAIGRASGRKPA